MTLWYKKTTRYGIISGLIVGFITTIVWSNFKFLNSFLSERLISFVFAFLAIYIVSNFKMMKIKQVFENLRNNVHVNSYYLKGDDQFLQEFFPKYVTDYTFGKQPIEKVFIISDEVDKKNQLDEILTSDLFSSKKVFILKNFQRLKSKQQDEILEYVKEASRKSSFIYN